MTPPGHVGGLTGVVHQVSFRWKEGTTPDQIAALEAALAALPGRFEGVLAYGFGPDLGIREGNADYGLVGVFADEQAYASYAADEFHLALIRDHVLPIVAERLAVQYRIG
jgi:Stress responsive A/B Barrel Domain